MCERLVASTGSPQVIASPLLRPLLPPDGPVRGLVQVYTGEGKGKTSAALGLALRAASYGLRVHMVCFMKGNLNFAGERAATLLPSVTVSRFGGQRFVNPRRVTPKDREQAHAALADARQAMLSGNYDVVILDEVNVASSWDLVGIDEVLGLLAERPDSVELVLTGRYADPRIIEKADLVTEMVSVKHPFEKGVSARRGIDF